MRRITDRGPLSQFKVHHVLMMPHTQGDQSHTNNPNYSLTDDNDDNIINIINDDGDEGKP